MKIKSIKKTGPGLFLITYAKRFWEKKSLQRFAIQRDMDSKHPSFDFRDNDDIVYGRLGGGQLSWMVVNNVDYFDNDEEIND